jgi:hypothetical protein
MQGLVAKICIVCDRDVAEGGAGAARRA